MAKRLFTYIKQNKSECFFAVLSALLFALFTYFCTFFIIQSDDYYYASFLKNGIAEFFRLTCNHFLTFNGRALVHFFAQLSLSLPHTVTALTSSFTVFAIGFFSYKILSARFLRLPFFMHMSLFYSLVFFLGRDVFKEGIMWISAFYNYVFPLLILLLAINFKNKPYGVFFAFLSGATTEQWGIVSLTVLFVFSIQSYSKKPSKELFSSLLPSLSALLGYLTIYLSPATLSRITSSAHTSLQKSIVDLPRMSEVFMNSNSVAPIFAIFITATLLMAFLKGGRYKSFYIGFLPLSLILISFFTKNYLVTYIFFILYLVFCAVFFFLEKNYRISSFLTGAFVSVMIMLPTNTFETRICTPAALLLIIAIIAVLSDLTAYVSDFKKLLSSLLITVLSLAVFSPTFSGFFSNSLIEKENLSSINKAKESGSLSYNIDYDKNYAMKQMFNDGWFYNEFLSLYEITDCSVNLKSKYSIPLEQISEPALLYNGELYAPVRSFLSSLGGSIDISNDTVMSLNGKTLTLSFGMLVYTDKFGTTQYLVADDNKIPNFYTLYLKLDVLNDAFDLNIKEL